jgi:hypothetical protein
VNTKVDESIDFQLSPSELFQEVSEKPEERDKLFSGAITFALTWIHDHYGSAQEFVQSMEGKFGLKIRMYLVEILDGISALKTLSPRVRDYLDTLLSHEELTAALGAQPRVYEEEISSLDELFRRSIHLQSSQRYAEAIAFIARFTTYSAYNNFLVYLQNPHASYWATAAKWKREFSRSLTEVSRPMVILAPKTPIAMVYDITDTEGKDLPEWFNDLFKVKGRFDETVLDRTIRNCLAHDAIDVIEKELGFTHGGSAIRLGKDKDVKIRIDVKAGLDRKVRYAILCHELAHIYLGHLGSDGDKWWPSRLGLNRHQREIEAESVAYIVCRRIGLVSPSAEYLVGHILDPDDVTKVSIHMIAKVAGRIERMGQTVLPKRKPKAKA